MWRSCCQKNGETVIPCYRDATACKDSEKCPSICKAWRKCHEHYIVPASLNENKNIHLEFCKDHSLRPVKEGNIVPLAILFDREKTDRNMFCMLPCSIAALASCHSHSRWIWAFCNIYISSPQMNLRQTLPLNIKQILLAQIVSLWKYHGGRQLASVHLLSPHISSHINIGQVCSSL